MRGASTKSVWGSTFYFVKCVVFKLNYSNCVHIRTYFNFMFVVYSSHHKQYTIFIISITEDIQIYEIRDVDFFLILLTHSSLTL